MKGMTEDDCLAHLTWRYGLTIPESIEILLAAQRGYPVLIRSSNDQRGISCLSETAEEYMQSNRAGVNEQTWTLDEIYDYYCVQGQIQVPEL